MVAKSCRPAPEAICCAHPPLGCRTLGYAPGVEFEHSTTLAPCSYHRLLKTFSPFSLGEESPQAAMGMANPAASTAETDTPAKVAEPAGGGGADPALSDLEARLNNLKR